MAHPSDQGVPRGRPWSRSPETRPPEGVERLVTAAQRRLAITTLVLLVALLVVVGATTAALAQGSLDASVDRTLEAAATAELDRIHESEGTESGESGGSGAAGTGSGEEGDAGESEGSGASATSPAPSGPEGTADLDDHPPAAADTFFLYLDSAGRVVANPERVALIGLPNDDGIAAATKSGRDLRTVQVGETRVRLLTLQVPEAGTGQIRALQAGFVLTLHDDQARTLLTAIVVVGLGGLLGAAAVTLILTRRALGPVRAAFERERRFVAAASHELRTPVAVIRSTAEVLGREGDVRPRGEQLVTDIVSEADRLGRLVDELGDLAVAQAQRSATVAIELTPLVLDVARRARPLADSSGRRIDATAGPEVRIRGDEDRIVQVLLILVDNALRHASPGGHVTLGTATEGGRGQAWVADDGPGVPVADRARIFEPFARLVSVGSSGASGSSGAAGSSAAAPGGSGGGSGLGLAIARALVTGMGGDIAVDDAPSGGARFTVNLPLA